MTSPATGSSTSTRPTFLVLATAACAFSLLHSMVIPILPTLQAELGTTQAGATWIVTSYLLSASVCTPVLGRIGDVAGRKRLLVVALLALAVGSLLAALATDLAVMIVARVVQGAGGAVLPLAFGIVRDLFPAGRVSGAVGAIASLTAIGTALGVALTGPVVQLLGSSWLFWIPMAVTAGAALAAAVVVPASAAPPGGRVSWLPGVFLAGWLVCLLLALGQGPTSGWASAPVLGLFGLAALGVLLWIAAESRADHPLIDLRMLRLRPIWAANLAALLLGVGMFAMIAFLPQLMQTPPSAGYGFGSTVTVSGLLVASASGPQLVVGLLLPGLDRRFGARALLVTGAGLCAVALLGLAFAHAAPWQVVVSLLVYGAGIGLAVAGLAGSVVTAVPPHQTGVASGMNANIRTIGGCLGTALVSSIVTSRLTMGGVPEEDGYTIAFAVLGGCLLLAAGAGLLIPTRRDTAAPRYTTPAEGFLASVPAATTTGGRL